MECHAAAVINLAFRFLGSQADAEDVAQEVFLRLYQHPPLGTPVAKLSTWLYRVTVNRSLDHLRKRRSTAQTISLEAPVSSEEPEGLTLAEKLPDPSGLASAERIARAEVHIMARRAVAALPFSLKAPLLLSSFEELSHEEIGRILHVSPKAVERRLSRAREILQQRLQPYL